MIQKVTQNYGIAILALAKSPQWFDEGIRLFYEVSRSISKQKKIRLFSIV